MLRLRYDPCLDNDEVRILRTNYLDSFPEDERRPEEAIFGIRPAGLHLCVLYKRGQLIGLLTFWRCEGFVFVEHFFILPEYRSEGYGAEALRCFMGEQKQCVLLECEPPINTMATRRIKFYRSLGYERLEVSYRQPPYRAGGAYLDMYLMSTQQLCPDTVDRYIREIHTRVYGLVL